MQTQPESMLVEFIRYNNWANAQILAVLRDLPAETMQASMPGSYGTIHATLEHMVFAEADYISRVTGKFPRPQVEYGGTYSVAELIPYAETVGKMFLELVQNTPLTQIVHEEEDGNIFEYQARVLFLQVVNHGIEHRTNITTILSSLGIPTPELDGWGYVSAYPQEFSLHEERRGG